MGLNCGMQDYQYYLLASGFLVAACNLVMTCGIQFPNQELNQGLPTLECES